MFVVETAMARPLLMECVDTARTSRLSAVFRASRVARRAGRARGFTLIELSIVVAIVGVLAVIAVVGYRKITLSAKVTEAQNMISAIRIAQEDYKVERGIYADLGGAPWCPSPGLLQEKTDWNTGICAAWQTLPVHVDGPVRFGYKTTAGLGGAAPPASWVTMPAATVGPWYVITAQADLNGDPAVLTELVGTSFQNTIFARNEGE